ncbi:MAG: Serine protease, subfamily, contains C-terminal domain [Pseudonocardiales bacterium]|nr:Serine protease, subfamily, contains C-terminal domain [Pseudonocardiales bacterium]
MTEHPGRHAAEPSGSPLPPDDDFARPPGVEHAFAPRDQEPNYPPPPPTVAPEEQAVFGRPPGAAEFAPLAGERIPPRPTEVPPVPRVLAEAYAASANASGGFDPAPGSRISPHDRPPESPWWKRDALHDPWRDPNSPFWLGRGAIFSGGSPAQVAPEEDAEHEDDVDEPVAPAEQPPATTSKRGLFGLSALALMLVVGIVAGVLGGGAGYWLANRANHLLHRGDVTLSKTGRPANRPPGSVADIAKRVGPAVVSIAVTTPSTYAVGSGVVIDKLGYVLTNNHVVAAGGSSGATIVVTFASEATAKAQVVGRDPTSDLAVLKVPSEQLTVASLGDSGTLAVGDPVIAIGSPLGLQGTVTEGIVSALDRAVHVFADDGSSDAYLDAIQTDAAINPGNSGGALVDASGAVVGINSAAALASTGANGQRTTASGIGYAIPINYARTIAQQLIRSGKAVHASLGAQGRTATANDGLQQGAYLEQVVRGGAADKAGLRNGDVIVAADGKSIVGYDQLVVVVQAHKPADTISVTYYRGAAKRTATVTLGSA